MTIDRRAALAVLAVLGALVLVDAPSIGTDPQTFTTAVSADGLLASFVRAADSEWELGFVRAPALLAQGSDTERYGEFFRHLLDRGVYVAPSQFEAMFVSTAHGPAEVERTVAAAREILDA